MSFPLPAGGSEDGDVGAGAAVQDACLFEPTVALVPTSGLDSAFGGAATGVLFCTTCLLPSLPLLPLLPEPGFARLTFVWSNIGTRLFTGWGRSLISLSSCSRLTSEEFHPAGCMPCGLESMPTL